MSSEYNKYVSLSLSLYSWTFIDCRILISIDISFFKIGKTRPLFVIFFPFTISTKTNILQCEYDKSVNYMLGTQTRGSRMVGAEEFTELRRHPYLTISLHIFANNLLSSLNLSSSYVLIGIHASYIICCKLKTLYHTHKTYQ